MRHIPGGLTPCIIDKMDAYGDHIELVRQAQQGQAEARRDLALIAEVRLAEYVGRLTLDRDLTTDIVQESIAEMLKIFNTLKDPQAFWSWLYAITLNKVRAYYRRRWKRKETSLTDIQPDMLTAGRTDVLADVVTAELKQIVIQAISQLEPRQRAILTMRCYDQMSYSQIGEIMRCSELSARALFYRAKKTLTRFLTSRGVDKSAIAIALLVFGKITARSQAAALSLSIPISMLHAGSLLTVIVAAVQSAGLTAMLTVLLAGTLALTAVRSTAGGDRSTPAATRVNSRTVSAAARLSSCWYYYPGGTQDTVMIRAKSPTMTYSQWLQNREANYYRLGDTIYIRNHRFFAPDLSVWRLPTDTPALRKFLQAQDGRAFQLNYVAPTPRGLLVAVEDAQEGRPQQVSIDYDVSAEGYFRHDWSIDASIVDRRDDLHRRGWTYFTISGHLGRQPVSGSGRLPFTAAAMNDHGPWLKLTFGDAVTIVDDGALAEVRYRSGEVSSYPGVSFFRGLGRPWSGLHTIDTIRRDAALAGLPFETRQSGDKERVEIQVNGPKVRLTYRVHLYQDWIENMTFRDEKGTLGEWAFSYSENGEAGIRRVTNASAPGERRTPSRAPDSSWLMRLAQGTLTK